MNLFPSKIVYKYPERLAKTPQHELPRMTRASDIAFASFVQAMQTETLAGVRAACETSGIAAVEIRDTNKRDWVDNARLDVFGVVSHDTYRTCEIIDDQTGELVPKKSFKVKISGKKEGMLGTYNAQTIPVELDNLQVHNKKDEATPMVSSLGPAAAALAASYIEANPQYNDERKSIEAAALRNLMAECNKFGLADLYTDANVTCKGEKEGRDLVYKYKIACDYNKGERVNLVCVDRNGETSWGVLKQVLAFARKISYVCMHFILSIVICNLN